MRLTAALCVAMCPFVAATWSALHFDAVGAAGGVLWCIGLLAVLMAGAVVAAVWEGRVLGDG